MTILWVVLQLHHGVPGRLVRHRPRLDGSGPARDPERASRRGQPYAVASLRLALKSQYVYMMFQMTFAIITPALIAARSPNRMKFSAMIIFTTLWSIFVSYCADRA